MAISLQKVDKWAQKKKVGKLLSALSVNDTEIRIAAIKALGSTKEESAMHTLISLLKDPNPEIRFSTVEALGNMGNGRSLEFVRQLTYTETDPVVLEKAKWAVQVIRENLPKQD